MTQSAEAALPEFRIRTVGSTVVVDTFAEAFKMWGARVIITADSPAWALTAAQSMTGFATSIIGCKCEAGIEREWTPGETPDGRPGMSALLFTMDAESLGKRLTERIGQCVLTCATTACYNGLDAPDRVDVGGKLRFFGDGYQIAKVLNGRRFWRVPVMEGEFLIEEEFGVQRAVGGGNLLIMGRDLASTLRATEAAVAAMRAVAGAILPFPGGLVRSGSKIGSRYKGLPASTNDAYCPTLRGFSQATQLPAAAGSVLEIVIDGLTEAAVRECMRLGLHTAIEHEALAVTAGNYGGKLGAYKFGLFDLLEGA
jgi:formylmethanofuran--tetrahydromethanopterin N-formyltransferase